MTEKCTTCDGTGNDPGGLPYCRKCEGRGYICVSQPPAASQPSDYTEEQVNAATVAIRPCPVAGVTFKWLCEFANALAAVQGKK